MDSSSPSKPNSLGGLQSARRDATRPRGLLPPVELFSSPISAGKRKRDVLEQDNLYPTPVPTSSLGLECTSPAPHLLDGESFSPLRIDREPLSDVPTVVLPANGRPVTFGRSSKSADVKMHSNTLISRVHLSAWYDPNDRMILIECLGWNGAQIHCQGKIYELHKEEAFHTSEVAATVMIDAHGSRVVVGWPQEALVDVEPTPSSRSGTEEVSPTRAFGRAAANLASSPPPMPMDPPSPASSPAPAIDMSITTQIGLGDSHATITVYEDDKAEPTAPSSSTPQPTIFYNENENENDAESDADDANDDENDPLIHSFGPAGSSILSSLASFNKSPLRPRGRSKTRKSAPSSNSAASRSSSTIVSTEHFKTSPIKNHVINQLAFSRVHSIPLSTIMSALPKDLKKSTSADAADLGAKELESMLFGIPCVGEIKREGKDAAGKPLEDEFYYLPEMDDNTMRREAVTAGMGRTGLREVRKSHKQYYWKKPRN
ncbi:hypothetical protein EJ06DRAFT_353564 [Trichodelitschia bisporula]|uniref:FHA domain-containing protein n=1 Tax=Trichodelitschia bisporula TaxID=703511 RepID=A0A6G1I0J8_9PEZI|nr:hypothetical protein EJ06DRAFT_353564 [Trichodelitschia bisporula]